MYVGCDVERIVTMLRGSVQSFIVFAHFAFLLSWCLSSCGRSDGLIRKVNVTNAVTSVDALRTVDTSEHSADVYLNSVLSHRDSGIIEIAISEVDSVWTYSSGGGQDSSALIRAGAWPEQKGGLHTDSRSNWCGGAITMPTAVRHRSRRISVTSRGGSSVISADTVVAGTRDVSMNSSVSVALLSDSLEYDSLTIDATEPRGRWNVLSFLRNASFSIAETVVTAIFILWLIRWALKRSSL